AFGPPPIFGLGTAGGFELYLQNRGEGGPQRLAQVMGQFVQRAMKDPNFAFVQTLWRPATPQLYVDVDRDKAKALGVPLGELYGALAATLGNYYVNDFNKYGRTWQVLMSAEPQYRNSPGDVGDIYVRSERGDMIPLGLAVIMVFLILAAQYERWSLPLSVLLALPFGTFGALAAVWLRSYSNDVYFQIGLVTLLGLAAKNAILIVQFAELKESEGLS